MGPILRPPARSGAADGHEEPRPRSCGALCAGDEAGAESAEAASSSADAVAPAEASTAASEAPAATPDLLTDAEQISDEEVDAGRTAALKKMLEERGKQ